MERFGKLILALLALIFAGIFGLHRFVLGRVRSGLVMLALGITSLILIGKFDLKWGMWLLSAWLLFDLFWIFYVCLGKDSPSEDAASQPETTKASKNAANRGNGAAPNKAVPDKASNSKTVQSRAWSLPLKYHLAMRMLAAPKTFVRQARDKELRQRLVAILKKIGADLEAQKYIDAQHTSIAGRGAVVIRMPKVQASNEAHFVALVMGAQGESPAAFLLEEPAPGTANELRQGVLVQVNRKGRAQHDVAVSALTPSAFVQACAAAIAADGKTMMSFTELPLAQFEAPMSA